MEPEDKAEKKGRAELISAGTQLFAEHGYLGATTTAIARKAGVSQPLLYHHFGSKEGLWRAVIDELFGELHERLEKVVTEMHEAPAVERLTALLRTFVLFSGHRPELAQLIHTVEQGGKDTFGEFYQEWLSGLVDFFNREFEIAQGRQILRPIEPAILYFMIAGVGTVPFMQPDEGMQAFGVDTTSAEFIERYAEISIDIILRGVLPRQESNL